MYTSLGLLALAGSLVTAEAPASVTWQKDYTSALAAVARSNKPLAVVIGNGAGEAALPPSAKNLLARKYVTLYLDSASPAGAKLAQEFSVVTGKGLIISDAKGSVMAFHHDGALSAEELQSNLEKFADPNLTITTTATRNSRVSYYPSSGASQASGYAPTIRVNC